MKKLMNIFVLVAAAAMTLASCQKNEIDGPVNKEVHFTIKADFAETKTAIKDNGDKTYTPTWAKGDKIGVLFSLEESAKPVDFENTAVAGEKATFEGKHAFAVVEGASEVDGNLYAFYPSSAFNKMYSDGGVRLDLENTQYPTSTSFDPSCDLLIAKPCYYMAEATGADVEVLIDDMYFARMMSVLRINLNSEFLSNETVKSISFDADGVDFTGAMKFNLETGEFVGNQSTSQDLSEVKAVYSEEDPIAVAGEKNSAYLVVAPVTIPSGTALTFTIETENYDIVKTINAPVDMEMPAGNIAVINLTIAEENCTAKVEDTSDYSGEWLIVNSDLTRAANAWANGNNLPEFELTTNEGVILESDGIANCKMIITKEADGYTIQDASGMYLYAAGASDKNHLYGQETKSYWTIEKNETNYVITSLAKADRNILRYNSTNKIFSCYSSGQADVTLYKYSDIKPDTNPSITLTKNSDEVAYDATSYDFTYTTKNITGNVAATIKEGATMTNVSASASNGTVTVKFNANADAEQKTATIVLSYEGAASQEFVLTQEGKPAEGTPTTVTDKLVASLFSATSTTYADFSGVSVTSPAVYAGNSAKTASGGIQLRSKSNSGIVTTTSGGKAKTITVTWASGNTSGRTLDIYGKSTAYSAASDLYNSTARGTKLGSITEGTSTKLEITGDYEYIGLRSNDGAMFLTHIAIEWETAGVSGGEDGGETPDLASTTVTLSGADLGAASTTSKSMDSVISFANSAENTYSDPMRLYANTTFTITSQGKDITKVVFTCNSGKPIDGCVQGTVSLDAGASYTVEASDYVVTFTITGSTKKFALKASAQYRIDALAVTYKN